MQYSIIQAASMTANWQEYQRTRILHSLIKAIDQVRFVCSSFVRNNQEVRKDLRASKNYEPSQKQNLFELSTVEMALKRVTSSKLHSAGLSA